MDASRRHKYSNNFNSSYLVIYLLLTSLSVSVFSLGASKSMLSHKNRIGNLETELIQTSITESTTAGTIQSIPPDQPAKVCPEGVANAHSPFGAETSEMRYESVLIFAIITIILMTLRSVIRIISSNFSTFSNTTLGMIFRYSFMYMIFLGICCCFYTLGILDNLKFNVEGFLLGCFVFLLFFFGFSVILVFTYSSFITLLDKLDNNMSYNSFKSIKTQYERVVNKKFGASKLKDQNEIEDSLKQIFTIYEFLIMKLYFIVPFYPVFKPSTLRSDFAFGNYLSRCLTNQLKNYYSFSWTTLILTVCFLLIWNAAIEPYPLNVSINNIDFLGYLHDAFPLDNPCILNIS